MCITKILANFEVLQKLEQEPHLAHVDSGLLQGGEDTGALNDVLGTSAGPIDVGRVPLTKNGDLLAVYVQEFAILRNLA